MKVVVAVDLSTTAAKAMAFDPEGHVVASARRSLTRASPVAGWQEQSAPQWWTETAAALSELTAELLKAGHEPAVLGITHQRETFVCLDEQMEPLRPAILWLDTRAGDQVGSLGSPEVHRLSGKPPSTTPSYYKIGWLREHEPEILNKTRVLLDVHGYLAYQLTGQLITSTASADPLGLMDMRTFSWSEHLLQSVGLNLQQMPSLCQPGTVMGQITAEAARLTGLPQGLPVAAGAGDGQCAGLGAAISSPGTAYLSLGTSITTGVHSDSYLSSRSFRTLSSPIAGSYTLEAFIASGAASITWFKDHLSTLALESDAENKLGIQAARVEPGSRRLLFLPYLTSAETPYWDDKARAAFIGLDDQHGLPEMYRAVLEGLAFELRLLLEELERSTGESIHRVITMGGGSQSGLWMQITADVLGKEIVVCETAESVALGAAILAANAIEFSAPGTVQQRAARMCRTGDTYTPQPAIAAVYNDLYAVYRDIYPALKTIFSRLGDAGTKKRNGGQPNT